MTPHPVVAHDAWLAARKEHLKKEKEFTRLRDELSRQRRELPWGTSCDFRSASVPAVR